MMPTGPSSRVLRSRGDSVSAAAAPSAFVALLRSSKAAGDFASFISHLRSLSPAALDLELRAMMVLEGSGLDKAADEESEEVRDVGLLLEALQGELDAARNFEMVQALLARVLVVSWPSMLACCPDTAKTYTLPSSAVGLHGTWHVVSCTSLFACVSVSLRSRSTYDHLLDAGVCRRHHAHPPPLDG
jgi:hypothetical protein